MLFNTVAFSALLLASATAAILHERSLEDGLSALYRRQYQFQPGTQTATGNTCADAFGSGYTMCREQTATSNRLCYNPTAGQTCCSSSWACPNGSGCSATSAGSYCCPNGQDAKSCAAANAVSSSTSSSARSSSTLSSSSRSSSSASKIKTSSSAIPTAYNYAVPSSYSVKNVTSSSAVKVAATVTGTYPIASASAKAPVQFEGAASSLGMSFSGLLGAAFLGVMAALF